MSNKYLGSIKCCLISFVFFIGFSANGSLAVESNHKSELTLSHFTDAQTSSDSECVSNISANFSSDLMSVEAISVLSFGCFSVNEMTLNQLKKSSQQRINSFYNS